MPIGSGAQGIVLSGERVLLRPFTEPDVAPLTAILAEPAVARWWGAHDEDRIRRELLEDRASESYAIEMQGEVVGVVMVAEEDHPDYRHAGLDIALSTRYHGRGLGRDALRLMIHHLVESRGHHRLTIDPAADNELAIRCYRGVGFKPVGIMRRYERMEDGGWRDGLLMDLLSEELDPRA